MRDVYTKSESTLQTYLDAFPCQSGQKGALVFLHGEPTLDLLSRSASYARLHAKLVRSYALDAMLAEENSPEEASVAKGRTASGGQWTVCEERRDPGRLRRGVELLRPLARGLCLAVRHLRHPRRLFRHRREDPSPCRRWPAFGTGERRGGKA